MYKNIELARKDISNKLMKFRSDRKNPGGILPFGGKRSCLKRIRSCVTGKKGGGSRHGRSIVTADKVLSCF